MKETGRVLGVDFGDSRTGISLSDPGRLLAQGIDCIHDKGMGNTAKKTAALAKERGAVRIVVGLPKNMDGTEGFRAERVRVFCELLGKETVLPIELYDERLSTMEAHRIMNYTETFGRKRKEQVDTLSAQIILQDWLDRQKNKEDV